MDVNGSEGTALLAVSGRDSLTSRTVTGGGTDTGRGATGRAAFFNNTKKRPIWERTESVQKALRQARKTMGDEPADGGRLSRMLRVHAIVARVQPCARIVMIMHSPSSEDVACR